MKRVSFLLIGILCWLTLYSQDREADKINVALLGDSMTWIGGENFDNPNGWTYYLKDLPLDMRLYARSGATWCNTTKTRIDDEFYSEVLHPDNVIYNQMHRLISDRDKFNPDIIIIYAGANDAWFADKRPGLFCKEHLKVSDNSREDVNLPTSLEGSVKTVAITIKSYFQDAQIYFVTPVYAGKIPSERIEKVGDIIEACGETLGIPVLRGDRLLPFREADEQPGNLHLTYDGAHSNPKGAKAIADCFRENIFVPYVKNLK